MATTAPAKKKRKKGRYSKKLPKWVPLILGLGVVCAIVAGILMLESRLTGPEPEPVQPSTTAAPTQPPLPSNPYGPADFAYNEAGYLSCLTEDYRLGIDVSDHQGEIDWQQVADAGIEFAFIRIGYRGYEQGLLYTDDYAEYNLREARAAGLQIGAYFYSQALNEEEAAEEAAFCIEFLGDYGLDLPLVYDWEYVSGEARTGSMRRSDLTACARVFCEAVAAAGFEPMIYSNPNLAETLLDLEALREYPLWLAMYTDCMDYPYAFDLWQYTDSGSVPGIEGNVDINLMIEKGASS